MSIFMNISIKKHFYAPWFLKISSLILGYILWTLLSHKVSIFMNYRAPLYFYNTHNISINAPEDIGITLYGPKPDIFKLIKENNGVYIDAQQLPQGSYPLNVSAQSLSLPYTVKILSHEFSKIDVNKA